MPTDKINELGVERLKAALKAVGQPVSGNKPALQVKLRNWLGMESADAGGSGTDDSA